MRWLRRDGLDLAVHESGEGPVVLLQHGLGGDARQVGEAWPPLPGWRRVTLECRGHGGSPEGRASVALFAGDLAALAEELNPPVVLGGISMGAALSLRLAVLRPDLVRGLILIRPAWIADPAPPNMAPVAEVADLLRRFGPAEAQAQFLSSALARRLSLEAPDNLSSLLGYFDRPREGLPDMLAAIASDGPGVTEEQIAALDVPCLVCGSRDDLIHPYAMAERLAGLIPGARFAALPPKGRDRAAHFAALRAAIDDVVTRLPG